MRCPWGTNVADPTSSALKKRKSSKRPSLSETMSATTLVLLILYFTDERKFDLSLNVTPSKVSRKDDTFPPSQQQQQHHAYLSTCSAGTSMVTYTTSFLIDFQTWLKKININKNDKMPRICMNKLLNTNMNALLGRFSYQQSPLFEYFWEFKKKSHNASYFSQYLPSSSSTSLMFTHICISFIIVGLWFWKTLWFIKSFRFPYWFADKNDKGQLLLCI